MVDGVLEDDESTTFHIAPIEFVDVGLGGHQDFQGPQPQSGPSTSPQGIHTRQDPPLSEADFDKLEDVTGWVNDEAMNHLAKSFVCHCPHWRLMSSFLPHLKRPLAER